MDTLGVLRDLSGLLARLAQQLPGDSKEVVRDLLFELEENAELEDATRKHAAEQLLEVAAVLNSNLDADRRLTRSAIIVARLSDELWEQVASSGRGGAL